jgi:hypothetical protein
MVQYDAKDPFYNFECGLIQNQENVFTLSPHLMSMDIASAYELYNAKS